MSKATFSSVTRWFIAVVVITAVAAAATNTVNGSSASERALNWVVTQERLPSTLDEILLYPQEYRRQILAVTPASYKHGIWREYLTRIADRPELGEIERMFVMQLRETISVQDFEWMQEPSDPLRALLAAAPQILGENIRLLRGPVENAGELDIRQSFGLATRLRTAAIRLSEGVLESVTVYALDNCTCWVDDDGAWDGCAANDGHCCPTSYIPDNPQCRRISQSGCSLFDNRPCDGTCCGGDEPPPMET